MVLRLKPPQPPLLALAAVEDPRRPNPPPHPHQVVVDPRRGAGLAAWAVAVDSEGLPTAVVEGLEVVGGPEAGSDYEQVRGDPGATHALAVAGGQEVDPLVAVGGPRACCQEDVLHLQVQGHHHDAHLQGKENLDQDILDRSWYEN